MDNWDDNKAVFLKSLNKFIENKYVIVAEYIAVDGLAAQLTNDLYDLVKEKRKQSEVSQMFDTMKKYFPKMFDKLINDTEVVS